MGKAVGCCWEQKSWGTWSRKIKDCWKKNWETMPWAELEIKPRLQSKKEMPPGPPSRCKKEWIRCSQITAAGYGYAEDIGTLPGMVTERMAVKGASERRYWLKYSRGKSKEKQKMPEVKKKYRTKEWSYYLQRGKDLCRTCFREMTLFERHQGRRMGRKNSKETKKRKSHGK